MLMASPQASFPKTAAIISRPNRPQVAQIVPGLLAWLADHGYKVIVDTETATYISGQEVVPRVQMASRSLDLVVVLGYNDDPVVPGKGSAIFLHLARPDYSHTQGCVALAYDDAIAAIGQLRPGDQVVIS